jgi:hypothetical protein
MIRKDDDPAVGMAHLYVTTLAMNLDETEAF